MTERGESAAPGLASCRVLFEPSHEDLAHRVDLFAAREGPAFEAEPEDPAEEDEALVRAVRSLAADDLLSSVVPSFGQDGRARYDVRALCVARERLARASGLLDVAFAMQGLGSAPVALATGRRAFPLLERVARGEEIAAFALTEPEAGSDAAAIATEALPDGDGFRLRGTKTLISNAGVATFYTVFARTRPQGGRRGIGAFLVRADAPGVEVVERLAPSAAHPLGVVRFRDVRLGTEARLDEGDRGLDLALSTLDVFRVTVGAAACGLAARALEETLRHVSNRKQFGRPLADFQLVRAHLADMACDLDASRLLVARAACALDEGRGGRRLSSQAKLFATEAAQRVVDRAVQLHGGAGVLRGSVTERLYREVRALRIYEGTSEIQRLVIGRDLARERED